MTDQNYIPPDVTEAAERHVARFFGYTALVLKAPVRDHSADDRRYLVGEQVYVYRPGGVRSACGCMAVVRFHREEIQIYRHDIHLWEFEELLETGARKIIPSRPGYIRSLIGKQVRVISAPLGNKHFEGRLVNIDDSKNVENSLVSVCEGLNVVPVYDDESHLWEFEELRAPAARDTSPPIADSSSYNETRFAQELDAVIKDLTGRLDCGTATLPLTFKRGESLMDALSKVTIELMLRKIPHTELRTRVAEVFADAREMVIAKNAAYGDSALNPVRVFATASPMEQLLVRLDDKVSRLERGQAAGEDVAKDMLGYLLLVLIAQKREATAAKEAL